MIFTRNITKQELAYYLKSIREQATILSDPENNGFGADDPIWKELYDKIFSKHISEWIFKSCPDFHYVDPDTSYCEDVNAFIDGFCEYAGVSTW